MAQMNFIYALKIHEHCAVVGFLQSFSLSSARSLSCDVIKINIWQIFVVVFPDNKETKANKNCFFSVFCRQFLWSFRLPGEAQKIDRMMECFAQVNYNALNGLINDYFI